MHRCARCAAGGGTVGASSTVVACPWRTLRVGECPFDRGRLVGETGEVFGGGGTLARVAAQLQLQGDQLEGQGVAQRAGLRRQVVLDPRAVGRATRRPRSRGRRRRRAVPRRGSVRERVRSVRAPWSGPHERRVPPVNVQMAIRCARRPYRESDLVAGGPELADQLELPCHRTASAPQPFGDLVAGVALHSRERHPAQSVVAEHVEQPPQLLLRQGCELRFRRPGMTPSSAPLSSEPPAARSVSRTTGRRLASAGDAAAPGPGPCAR